MALGSVNVPSVVSFNGRIGDVMPKKGDYTAKDVGALSEDWKPELQDINDALTKRKINGKSLGSDITLTAKDLNIKIFSAGTTAPADTSLLWIDTTAITGGLKYHNGSAWVHVPVAYT